MIHRVPTGRVIFEIGGTPIREELAREGERFVGCHVVSRPNSFGNTALRLAIVKLPTAMEFITRDSPPRLGNILLDPQPSVNSSAT